MSVHNESEAHKGKIGGKFLGDTKGNRDLYTDRSYDMQGGSGEAHKPYAKSGEFLGETKGNKDLPTNRSSDTPGGYGGGKHKAGGSGKKGYPMGKMKY